MIQYHFVTKPSSYGAYISGPAFYKWWLAIMNLADSIFSFFSTLIYSCIIYQLPLAPTQKPLLSLEGHWNILSDFWPQFYVRLVPSSHTPIGDFFRLDEFTWNLAG